MQVVLSLSLRVEFIMKRKKIHILFLVNSFSLVCLISLSLFPYFPVYVFAFLWCRVNTQNLYKYNKNAHIKRCMLNTMKNRTQNRKPTCWQFDETKIEGSTFPSVHCSDQYLPTQPWANLANRLSWSNWKHRFQNILSNTGGATCHQLQRQAKSSLPTSSFLSDYTFEIGPGC